jgi:ribosomal protein S18 acetylase RimI-like enzyme
METEEVRQVHFFGGSFVHSYKMNDDIAVYSNLASLLQRLGTFPRAIYSGATPGTILYYSGTNDAYENYALLSPDSSEGSVESGMEFFSNGLYPHIWPIFPGVSDELCRALENYGLARDDDFQAMIAELGGEKPTEQDDRITGPVRDENEANEWADCAWLGFDSEDKTPDSFSSIIREMSCRDDFFMTHIRGEATGMLFANGTTCGIYYVATCPEFRGRGHAGAIVENLKSLARELGFAEITLLATPSGRRLYKKHGFRDCGGVKIYKPERRQL